MAKLAAAPQPAVQIGVKVGTQSPRWLLVLEELGKPMRLRTERAVGTLLSFEGMSAETPAQAAGTLGLIAVARGVGVAVPIHREFGQSLSCWRG